MIIILSLLIDSIIVHRTCSNFRKSFSTCYSSNDQLAYNVYDDIAGSCNGKKIKREARGERRKKMERGEKRKRRKIIN